MVRTVRGLGAASVLATVLAATPAGAACGVFDNHPCTPTFCSVFRHGPCIPGYEIWIGQDLRLTIASADAERLSANVTDDPDASEHKLNSIRDMFAALRACWVPPDKAEARPGMQMSVRFAFKRNGDIIATPRVTYTSPDTPPAVREIYHNAITAALERCTPLKFTNGLGGAIAGRPIAIRFVDNRNFVEQP